MVKGITLLIAIVCAALSAVAQGSSMAESEMVKIKGGTYIPLYGDTTPVAVGDFLLDKYPVTNKDYLAFLKAYPKWQKGNVKKIFADPNYLKHWQENLSFDGAYLHSPVTNVSWFAARAYCECQGKQLPTIDMWEYAGQASETKANASKDYAFYQRILDWYGKPNPAVFPPVQASFRNYWGLYGMHGLVWEWVQDFNATMLAGESRANTGIDRQLFCAGGSAGVQDSKNYVAFMRYAFRSSLKANYTVANLGFRCAKPIEK
ncbi:formylglycine-generating enzyme family protein [Cesiribacter sp. SM1]|uniref:formylglycine-generating enzyme family protein n=1 Tax=Cesiribacter sp. SM1 TaxID=2861196 RepID=UPI001CD53F4F|nr:formylglycine-generating enzyme family protein [Cesiribacter sp. SM1]